DPTRRAQLYREYTQENLRSARDLAQPRGGGARAAIAPGTSAPPAPPSSRAAASPRRPVRPSPSAVAPTTPRSIVPPPGGYANSPSPASPSPAGRLTPSEVLRRSEPLDRENRANVPLLPPNR
ncbi:MAG: hypothetical protein ACM35G_12160, partial [Planctomycetaceae bacterium]